MPDALVPRQLPNEATELAGRFARALERYLQVNGGAASRAQIAGVVRTWVPRWEAEIPAVLADVLIEGLVRQGRAVATRHHVGLRDHVERWRVRFRRYPQRFTQPVAQVASACDLPQSAVASLRALIRVSSSAA